MARDLAWGDIRLVEFDRPDKTRPVLVLTRTRILPRLSSVTVAPITRMIRGIPTEVPVGPTNGLKEESVVNLDHVQTIDKARIGTWLGTVGAERKEEIRRALLFALELES